MKEFLKNSFSHRPFAAYLILASGIMMLLVDIFYIALGGGIAATAGNASFLSLSFLLILLGAVLSIVAFFLYQGNIRSLIGRNLPACSAILYGFALGMQCYQVSFPLADLLTKVYFFGGNWILGVVFIVLFLVATLADVVACFFKNETQAA